eukprot:6191769-Pleurochrysis_carterae.AAC.6
MRIHVLGRAFEQKPGRSPRVNARTRRRPCRCLCAATCAKNHACGCVYVSTCALVWLQLLMCMRVRTCARARERGHRACACAAVWGWAGWQVLWVVVEVSEYASSLKEMRLANFGRNLLFERGKTVARMLCVLPFAHEHRHVHDPRDRKAASGACQHQHVNLTRCSLPSTPCFKQLL